MKNNEYMAPSIIIKNEKGEICPEGKNYTRNYQIFLCEGTSFTICPRDDDVKNIVNSLIEEGNVLRIFAAQLEKILKHNEEVTQMMIDNFYRQVWLYHNIIFKALLKEDSEKKFYISDNINIFIDNIGVEWDIRRLTKGKTGRKFKKYVEKYKGNFEYTYFCRKPLKYKAPKNRRMISEHDESRMRRLCEKGNNIGLRYMITVMDISIGIKAYTTIFYDKIFRKINRDELTVLNAAGFTGGIEIDLRKENKKIND